MMQPLLAQAPPPGPAPGETFTNIFWLSIGFIFLVAIVSAVVARRRKDRCLKLFNDYHVTLHTTQGQTVWGDLAVYAQGIETCYDAAYQTAHGLIKSGYLLYDTEMPRLQAIVRYCGDFSPEEAADHRRQLAARVNPGVIRRFLRWVQSWVNTIRDAFGQALSVFVGAVARSGRSTVVQTQQGQVENLGKTLLGAAVGNAYEPMLEMHIGKPVVVEMLVPNDPAKRTVELAGYLAEYSDKFICIFNPEHRVTERLDLLVDQSVDRPDVKVDLQPSRAIVTNLSPIPLAIEAATGPSGRRELGAVITLGGSARVTRPAGGEPLMLHLGRVPRVDLIASRAQAAVRYASLEALPEQQRSLAPNHDDARVSFP